jgi:Cu/Ag efflux pump CusA
MGAYAMPNVSKPPVMMQPLSASSRALMVGLSSKKVSLIDMSVLARWTVTPKLLGVKGVANVAIWGQRARQLQVQVDAADLRSKRITVNQVVKSAGDALWASPLSYLEASTPGAGGWIDTPNQRLAIQHVQPISVAGDLAKVNIDGTPLNLGDVADVVEQHPPLIGDALVNNGEGLLLVIEKFPDADAREVVAGVKKALAELGQGMPDIEVDTSIYQATSFIDLSSDNIRKALLIGGAMALLVLLAFYMEWRSVAIAIAAIALSALAALLVLVLRGAPINIVVVAGLLVALGTIIDDAIVEVDNFRRRLAARLPGAPAPSRAAVIEQASMAMRRPLLYATIIMALAVMPIFFLGGLQGAFFKDLPVSYLLAILASMAVALTVTPVLAHFLYRDGKAAIREVALVQGLERNYESALSRALKVSTPLLPVAALAGLSALMLTPLVKSALVPVFKEPVIRVDWEAAPGTSHPEMRRIMTRAGDELRGVSGVRNVSAHLGRAITGDQVVNIDSGQFWIGIDQKADYAKTLAAVQETISSYPGLTGKVQTYLSDKVAEVLHPGEEPIVVRVEGLQRATLRAEAEKVRQILAGVKELCNLTIDQEVYEPHIEVKVDIATAGKVGLKPGDVRRAAATAFAGLEVGNLYEQQKVFEVVVWSTPAARHSISDVRDLLIDTPDGNHVRLGDVAEVKVVATPKVINREGVTRHVDIRAHVRSGDIAAARREVQDRLQKIEFPLEYHALLLGDYAERQSMWQRTLLLALASLIGTYFLLQACFQSWRLAAAVLAALAAALAGGAFAVLAGGSQLMLGSLFGFLAVLAIAVRNSVLLVSRYQDLQRERGKPLAVDEIVRVARERSVPVIMTALATLAVFLPFLFMGDIAGLEMLYPMAAVIVGGLVTSTIVTLFIVPALFLRYGSRTEPDLSLA